jgi:hypothetical protein
MPTFIKIKNPKKPGESLVLADTDFNPAVHELFSEEPVTMPAPVSTGNKLDGYTEPPIVEETPRARRRRA